MNAEYMQRAIGAVVGSAVGDALGAPYEFGPAGQFSLQSRAGDEMVGGGSFGWAPGEFTDDTQMAILQAESLLARGGFDGADLFERFGVWAVDAPDVGLNIRAALMSGRPWHRAAGKHFRETGHGAGNGTVMRAAPAAVLAAQWSSGANVDLARATAAVTHGDPAAGWGTALVHLTIAAALRGDDPWAALDDALDLLPPSQSSYRELLAPTWTPTDTTIPNGTVWTCLAQAAWAVRRAERFEDAVIAAIDLGGDTDTVAAVAGGLAGAIWGADAIPERWTTPLHGHLTTATGRVTYRHRDLVDLTHRLLIAGQ